MSLRPRAQAPAPDVNSGGDLPGRLHRVLSIGQTHRLLNGPTASPVAESVQAALPKELPLGGCCELDYDSESSNASYEVGECGEVGAGLALDQLEAVEVGSGAMRKAVGRRLNAKVGVSKGRAAAKKRAKQDDLAKQRNEDDSAVYEKGLESKNGYYTDYTKFKEDYNELNGEITADPLRRQDKLLAHRFAGTVVNGNTTLGQFLATVEADPEAGKASNDAVRVAKLAKLVSTLLSADIDGKSIPPLPESDAKTLWAYYRLLGREGKAQLARKRGMKDLVVHLGPLMHAARKAYSPA